MESESSHSWSPTCSFCNTRDAFIHPGVNTNHLRVDPLSGNYSEFLRAFKCPCTRTWFGCALCGWSSPTNGVRFKRKYPLVLSNLVDHFLSPDHRHRNTAMEHDEALLEEYAHATSVALPASLVGYHDHDDSFSVDRGDALSESDPAGSLSLSFIPTIEDVYNDEDQTKVAVATVFASIQNDRLRKFVELENKERLRGCRELVTRAYSSRRSEYSDAAVLATVEGTHLMALYARLFVNLSVKDRIDFVWLTSTLFSTDRAEEGTLFGPIQVPTNLVDASRICMTGNNSILKAVAIPKLLLVPATGAQQHAVVDPIDCLTLLFMSLPKDSIENIPIIHASLEDPACPSEVSSYFQSKAFIDTMTKAIHDMKLGSEHTAALLLSFKLWSDGWDPDGTKSNRNGVWSLVWTIMIGEGPAFVFPLAIGSKSFDHQPVLRWILDRISSMGEYITLYHLAAKRNVRVKLNLALYNVDRLERGELWGGMNHSANRGKCHGVVYGFVGGKKCDRRQRNSACPDCVKSLVVTMLNPEMEQDSPLCLKCACYDPLPTNNCTTGPIPEDILQADFSDYIGDIPEWPPESICFGDPSQPPIERPVKDDGNTEYGAVRVSQAFNVKAAQFITYQVWSGAVVGEKVPLAWGQVCGWSEKTSLRIYEAAIHHKSIGTSLFSDVFVAEQLPPTWVVPSLSLDKFLDAPMHLLFLGIVHTLTDMVEGWLAIKGLKSSFLRFASAACEKLGKLSLQYLRLLKYGSSVLTRGLWVSEQYVAFSRVLVILHSGLVLAINEKKRRPESEIKTVLCAIESCFCCISLLMQRTMTQSLIARATISIKIYLAAVDDLSVLLAFLDAGKKGKEPASQQSVPTGLPDAVATAGGLPDTVRKTGKTLRVFLRCYAVPIPEYVKEQIDLLLPLAEAMWNKMSLDDRRSYFFKAKNVLAGLPVAVSKSVKTLKEFLLGCKVTFGGRRKKDYFVDLAVDTWKGMTHEARWPYLDGAAFAAGGKNAGRQKNPPTVDDLVKTFVLTSSANPNHASTANLPRSMGSHGPPVDQWEGADGGEKAIQSIKPFLHGVCVIDGGLLLAALKRYYQNRSLTDIAAMLAVESTLVGANRISPLRSRYTKWTRYRNREAVEEVLLEKGALSGRLYEHGNTQVVAVEIGGGQKDSFVYLPLILSAPTSLAGRDFLHFSAVSLSENVVVTPENVVVTPTSSSFTSYVTLIPGTFVWRDVKFTGCDDVHIDGLYTLVTDDYRVLLADGKIGIKNISPSLWDKYQSKSDEERDSASDSSSYSGTSDNESQRSNTTMASPVDNDRSDEDISEDRSSDDDGSSEDGSSSSEDGITSEDSSSEDGSSSEDCSSEDGISSEDDSSDDESDS
jgi:hypothetical protein